MKRFLLASAIVLAAAAGGTAYKAAADTPSPAPMAAPDHPPGPPWGGGWGKGPGPGPGPGWPRPGWGRHRDDVFSLFAKVKDKKLTTDDVKIIATAILLEHGNHDWTVSNVTTEADKSIEFSFATPHGDIIATFEIDPATGRIKRVS